MNRTKIEWCNYTWNPVVGCNRGCWYCYAKKIFERFNPGKRFEDIHVYNKRFPEPTKVKKPSKIFVGSMTDIMDPRILATKSIYRIFRVILQCPQHTFMFLTKNYFAYQGLKNIPNNCWMGITITGAEPMYTRLTKVAHLISKTKAQIKFISFEPLLGEVAHLLKPGIDWIIIGGLSTQNKEDHTWETSEPYKKNVIDLLTTAKLFKIPVFIKDNLGWPAKMQQYPEISKKER